MQRGGPPLGRRRESPAEKHSICPGDASAPPRPVHTSTCRRPQLQPSLGARRGQLLGGVTSVFRKASRVLTRLGSGVKSTLLQSVIQKRSTSKLRWKTFSCSADMSGARLRRTGRSNTASIRHGGPVPGQRRPCGYLAAQVNLSMINCSSCSAVQK